MAGGPHGSRRRMDGGGAGAFSVVTVLLMARTGNTGRDIRHAEVRPATATADALLTALEPNAPKFTKPMVANKWRWAFMMAMHFVGLVLIVGTIGLFNLRILGLGKQIPDWRAEPADPVGVGGAGD